MRQQFRTLGVSFALAVAVTLPFRPAHAQRADSPAPEAAKPADRPDDTSAVRPLRVGAIAGVGFPRPLAIEGLAEIAETVALGLEYATLPGTTINGVQASLWSLAGDARVFPFHNAFFVGLRAGYQHVGASTVIVVESVGSAPEQLSLDSWFVNPRIGMLWTSHEGLTVGVEAGLQIPISPTVASSLPLALVPSAQSTANALGSAIIPTVDLLRIGLLL